MSKEKGVLDIDEEGTISAFREKEDKDGAIINGGYMACNPEIFRYLKDNKTVFEKEPMRELAAAGELKGYYHNGFWQCMDTKREKDKLESLWESGNAPWKVWKD